MHRPDRPSARGAALATLIACAMPAVAQVAEPAAAASAPRAAMNMQQVIEHVAAIGYREIREVERKSDKLYEVKARDTKGLRVELLVDARSGEILKSEADR